MLISIIIEVNLYCQWLISKWTTYSIINNLTSLLGVFLLNPVVQTQTWVFIALLITHNLHGLNRTTCTIPPIEASCTGMIIVYRADKIVVSNLISLVVIGSNKDVFVGVLVLSNEVICIIRR